MKPDHDKTVKDTLDKVSADRKARKEQRTATNAIVNDIVAEITDQMRAVHKFLFELFEKEHREFPGNRSIEVARNALEITKTNHKEFFDSVARRARIGVEEAARTRSTTVLFRVEGVRFGPVSIFAIFNFSSEGVVTFQYVWGDETDVYPDTNHLPAPGGLAELLSVLGEYFTKLFDEDSFVYPRSKS